MPVSADPLVRRAKKQSPALPTPRILGVDDEAREDDRLPLSPRQTRISGERVRSEGSRARRLALSQQGNERSQQGGTLLGMARVEVPGHRRVRTFVRSPHFPEGGKPARTRSASDPSRTSRQERWQQGSVPCGKSCEHAALPAVA